MLENFSVFIKIQDFPENLNLDKIFQELLEENRFQPFS